MLSFVYKWKFLKANVNFKEIQMSTNQEFEFQNSNVEMIELE